MNNKGLIESPDFNKPEKYLESGDRTKVTEKIREAVKNINGNTEGMLVRNLLVWMNQNTKRLHNGNDQRKFRRTAEEILVSGERTGCCDSSTLFTALARSKNIPAMQVITLNKEWGRKIDNGERTGTEGHYFTACYLQNISGEREWVLIDSDRIISDPRDVKMLKMKLEDRNVDRGYYAFAYTRDYGDIQLEGIRIDSILNMAKVQNMAYQECDKEDIFKKQELERQK